jgi:hypothetical protein
MEYAMAKSPTRTPRPAARAGAAKAAPKTPVKAVGKPKKAGTAVKPAVKAAAKALAKAKPAKRAVAAPASAPANPRLVRDSFTMPEQEYAVLAEVKQACIKAGFEIKKSELLRIGVALIGQIDVGTLQGVLAGLPQLKTGRPRSR